LSFAAVDPQSPASAEAAARALTAARREARALPGFPGPLPLALAGAYAIQEAAIGLWPDVVAGWKVGRVPDSLQAELGQARVSGPIFARRVLSADAAQATVFPVLAGGFAAVEAEFVVRVGADTDPGKLDYTEEEARALVGAVHIGVETAGSPMATINEIGPIAVASDFGNNAGLILGPDVGAWRDALNDIAIEVSIDGTVAGRSTAASIPGGPLASLRFTAEHCARRGRPLKAGQLVSTGAVTGVHDIVAGQSARLLFHGLGEIACRAVKDDGQ
jgi:2-keto-4-pentenoate hydratase